MYRKVVRIMDGLLLYKQYLENVRKDILNYDLSTLDSKKFLDILKRVHEIEDLSYIDTILSSAGLDLSFWNSKDFLNKVVEIQSNLGKLYIDEYITEEETEVLNDYISAFADKEDEINDTLDYIYGEDGFGDEEIYADNFISSEDEFPTIETMLENNKDTLGSLFGFMKKMTEVKENEDKENEDKIVEEKEEVVEEEKEEIMSEAFEGEQVDEVSDIDFTNSDFIEFEDIEFDDEEISLFEDEIGLDTEETDFKEEADLEDKIDLEDDFEIDDNIVIIEENEEEKDEEIEEENNSDIGNISGFDESFDTSFLEEMEDEIETEVIKEKDFSVFLDENEEEIEGDKEASDIFDDIDSAEDFFEDSTYEELNEDLYEDDVPNIFDRDPESTNRLKEATEFFLNSRRLKKNDNNEVEKLKEKAKQRERLVEHPEVTDGEDALAKMMLSLGLGMMSIPKSTTGIMQKIKEGSKKLTENMIVGDDEDEE